MTQATPNLDIAATRLKALFKFLKTLKIAFIEIGHLMKIMWSCKINSKTVKCCVQQSIYLWHLCVNNIEHLKISNVNLIIIYSSACYYTFIGALLLPIINWIISEHSWNFLFLGRIGYLNCSFLHVHLYYPWKWKFNEQWLVNGLRVTVLLTFHHASHKFEDQTTLELLRETVSFGEEKMASQYFCF